MATSHSCAVLYYCGWPAGALEASMALILERGSVDGEAPGSAISRNEKF
jgi:hypothetical protein